MKILISEKQYRDIFLSEQKTYKKDGNYFVEENNTKFMFTPSNNTWYIYKSDTDVTSIDKYDVDGKLDINNVKLLKDLNYKLKKSGLYGSVDKPTTPKKTQWKDTKEGIRVIGDLSKLGIKLTNTPISMNHAYALATFESTKKLTQLISNKIGGTNWNKYSICVTKVTGKCAPGRYAVFQSFDLNMAEKINSYGDLAKGSKPPYYMILENFYFDSGKIKEDLDRAFKYDKDAYKSDLFPDGWWGWFTTYFGTDNYNTISTKISNISYLDLPKAESKVKVEDSQSLYDILNDGHTVLDIASILSLVLPPPIGIITSSTLDAINALWYLNEGSPGLAFFTAIGVTPGIKQAKYAFKSPTIDKNLINFLEEAAVISKAEGKLTEKTIEDLYIKHVKNLSKVDKLKFGQEFKNIAKNLDKNVVENFYKNVADFNKYSTYDKNLLKNLFKEEKNLSLLKKFGGDLDKVLNVLRKNMDKDAIKAVIIQTGLFYGMSEILPKLIPQEWIIEFAESGILGLEAEIQANGFNPEEVYYTFGVTPAKENEEQNKIDMELLEAAWDDNWRPLDSKGALVEVPKKYQTKLYKERSKFLFKKYKEGDVFDIEKTLPSIDIPIEKPIEDPILQRNLNFADTLNLQNKDIPSINDYEGLLDSLIRFNYNNNIDLNNDTEEERKEGGFVKNLKLGRQTD